MGDDSVGLTVAVVAREAVVIPGDGSVLDLGNGITSTEIRKAAPLMAATVSWARGLTGSIAVASLCIEHVTMHFSCPHVLPIITQFRAPGPGASGIQDGGAP
jgi:hypothetical protein